MNMKSVDGVWKLVGLVSLGDDYNSMQNLIKVDINSTLIPGTVKNLEYLWKEKRYWKTVNGIFLLILLACTVTP